MEVTFFYLNKAGLPEAFLFSGCGGDGGSRADSGNRFAFPQSCLAIALHLFAVLPAGTQSEVASPLLRGGRSRRGGGAASVCRLLDSLALSIYSHFVNFDIQDLNKLFKHFLNIVPIVCLAIAALVFANGY